MENMKEARELLKIARILIGETGGVSLEGLKGAIQFSPKYIGGKNFWIKASPYFREIRWRDRSGELGLRGAPQSVIDAFDYYGGNYSKLIKSLSKSGAFQTKRISMETTIGEEGLSKTWQAPFPPETQCYRCGGDARIAFVAHEGLDGEKTTQLVRQLHPNEGGDGGSYWPHDAIAVAVYLCRECLEPTALFNQA